MEARQQQDLPVDKKARIHKVRTVKVPRTMVGEDGQMRTVYEEREESYSEDADVEVPQRSDSERKQLLR